MAERHRLTLHVVNVGAGLANIIEVDEDNSPGMRSSDAARSCGRSCPDPTVYYIALLASSQTTFIIDDIIRIVCLYRPACTMIKIPDISSL